MTCIENYKSACSALPGDVRVIGQACQAGCGVLSYIVVAIVLGAIALAFIAAAVAVFLSPLGLPTLEIIAGNYGQLGLQIAGALLFLPISALVAAPFAWIGANLGKVALDCTCGIFCREYYAES